MEQQDTQEVWLVDRIAKVSTATKCTFPATCFYALKLHSIFNELLKFLFTRSFFTILNAVIRQRHTS